MTASALAHTMKELGARQRGPAILGVLASFRCTAACRNCCFSCGPEVGERIPQARLRQYLVDASALGSIRLVAFSGGEAFLLGRDLVELVELAGSLGMMTRIVSNGYWALDSQTARRVLRPLVEAGLNEINFSTGDDHQQFVPVERVATAAAVSAEHGLTVAVAIEAADRNSTVARRFHQAADQLPGFKVAFEEGGVTIQHSAWVDFAAPGDSPGTNWPSPVNRRNLSARRPCESVLTSISIMPNEDLMACCGILSDTPPDLTLGNLRRQSMGDMVARGQADLMKIWLFVEGPERIMAWCASKDPSIVWEDRFTHPCQTCRALYADPRAMAVIQRHYEEKMDEILGWYALYLAGEPPQSVLNPANLNSCGRLDPTCTL